MSDFIDIINQPLTGTPGPAKCVDTWDRQQEQKDLVEVNDKFVRLIDKVSDLEDEKRKLEKELEILQEYKKYKAKIGDIVTQETNELKQMIGRFQHDHEKIKAEREKNLKEMDDTKKRFEEEQKKKVDLEKECNSAKGELEVSQLEHVQLLLNRDDLVEELEFFRKGFAEEIRELQSHIQNKHVVLSSNNKRSLDMDDIIENARIQYANMAIRSKEEVVRWGQIMMKAMVNETEQQGKLLEERERAKTELLLEIYNLSVKVDSLKKEDDSQTEEMNHVQKGTDADVEKVRRTIAQLEEALKHVNEKYAGLIRDNQEMMNLKLKLDMEIATYRKLLEGEEARYEGGNQNRHIAHLHLPSKQHPPLKPETPQAPDPSDVSPTALTPPRTGAPQGNPVLQKRLLIRVDVEAGRVVSEKSYYAED